MDDITLTRLYNSGYSESHLTALWMIFNAGKDEQATAPATVDETFSLPPPDDSVV